MIDHGRTAGAAIAFAALVAFGCGGTDRLLVPLPTAPQEATLYDLLGVPVDRAAAFDLATGPGSVRTDLSSEWDWAFVIVPVSPLPGTCLEGRTPGESLFLPRGCFEGFTPSSGLLRSDRTFDEIVEAVGDASAYVTDAAVPVEPGSVLLVRSRPDPVAAAVGTTCRRFAKVEVLSVDRSVGSVTFRYFWNPNCNLRRLAPES